MSGNELSDKLESEYGTDILSEIIQQSLVRNRQPVRLFDTTKHSAEAYFRDDGRGKPYIQDFQQNKRYYPVTAYCLKHKVDYKTALSDLSRRYHGVDLTVVHSAQLPPRPYVTQSTTQSEPPSFPKVDYLPLELYQRFQTRFEKNGLHEYLRYRFGQIGADEVFTRYRLGTSDHWAYLGYLATCLPQFDVAGNLRQVKVMPFDAMNGRRIKKDQLAEIWNNKSQQYEKTRLGSDKTCFIGKQIARRVGTKGVNLQQCFFGEHLLLEHPDKKVALVEGESTAILCSLVYPQYLWLATGGSSGAGWMKPEVFGVLKGRDVTLWPDSGKLEDWRLKAKSLEPLVKSLQVSDYVENRVPPSTSNVDLRDLINRPYYQPSDGGPRINGELLTSSENGNHLDDSF